MLRHRYRCYVTILAILLSLTLSQLASAQRGGRRGFGGVSRVQLLTVDKVHAELKLTEEQKKLAQEVNEKLNEDRRGLFQGGGGDFAAMREKMDEMNDAASAKVTEKLDDAQKKRLTEIYVQLNGANALTDKEVAAALKVTEEQQQKLKEANDENRRAGMAVFQDSQDMSEEERTKAFEKLRKGGDERLMAVLTEDQSEQFGKMKGKEIEIDPSELFQRRGGRRGGGNDGGARPNRPE